MNWKNYRASVSTVLPLLAMTLYLAACQLQTTTRTAATDAAIAADVCRVWQPTTYSSRDTAETQLGNRANNAARDAYCTGAKADVADNE